MTDYNVTSGQSATYNLQSGDTEYVSAGGTAVATTVFGGGAELQIFSGGLGTGTQLTSGGAEDLYGGVDFGAFADNGFQSILNGGTAISGQFTDFSEQNVYVGGVASGGTFSGHFNGPNLGATVQNLLGGVAFDAVLQGGALQNIQSDSVAINTTATGVANQINLEGELVVSGVNDRLEAAVGGYGLLDVDGPSTILTIDASKQGYGSFYGPFTGEAVIGSTSELVLSQTDALASGTILFGQDPGGELLILGSDTPTETIGEFFQGDTIVIANPAVTSAAVSTDQVALFADDGTEQDINIVGVVNGGVGIEISGGNVVLTSFQTPSLDVGSGVDDQTYTPISGFIVGSGGQLTVESGAAAQAGYIGDAVLDIADGGNANNNYIEHGGLEDVLNGGTSTNDTILYGATMRLEPGARAADPYVQGAFDILSGGIAKLGTILSGGQLKVEAGGTSTNPVFSGGSLNDNGSVMINASAVNDVIGDLSGTGVVSLGGSAGLDLDGDAGGFTGSLVVGGGTAEIGAAAADFAGAIAFAPSSDPILQIDSPLSALPTATISGFATPLDIIDLRAMPYVSQTSDTSPSDYESAGIVTSGGTTTLSVNSGGAIYSLNLDPATTGDGPLTLSDDGAGGANITFTGAACYCPGTLIATERGDVAIEHLAIGDRVINLHGDAVPIKWIGRRTVDCRRHPDPGQVWPVRVSVNAFGRDLPRRDLWLSPDHAVFVNDVLIPIKYLINGTSIVQVPMDEVTYFHVELEYHDVLLAEGLPAESFLDMRDGPNYASRPSPVRLYPDYPARMWEAFGCARLVVTGPELATARALVARFATDRVAA